MSSIEYAYLTHICLVNGTCQMLFVIFLVIFLLQSLFKCIWLIKYKGWNCVLIINAHLATARARIINKQTLWKKQRDGKRQTDTGVTDYKFSVMN